jgi:hypothetical protein
MVRIMALQILAQMSSIPIPTLAGLLTASLKTLLIDKQTDGPCMTMLGQA